MITFSIPGQPIAHRVRHQSIERNAFIEVAKSAYTDKPVKGVLIVHLNFVVAIPRKLQGRFEKGQGIAHTSKPDLDDLTRFALLHLQNIAFRSSGQIVRVVSSKCYGFHPRTDVTIEIVSKKDHPASLPFDDLC